jgi:starch-binding outer membrane protein, SusD/RagB family
MKNYLKYLIAVTLLLPATSCDTDFLNVTPEDRVKSEDVWKDPALVEAFVNEIYRGLNHGIRELMLGSLADESHFIHNYGSAQVVQSNVTASDLGSFTRGDFEEFNWTVLYTRIRQVNVFLENIESVPFEAAQEDWKDRMKGEVHFLNAYFYHNLVRL